MYKQTEDEEIKVNYLVLGAMVFASFLIYQLRVRKTLKKMILDKQG